MSDGKRYLITGGSGFIGRHLVKYLVDSNEASFIRVADKVMPVLAYMNDEFKAAFNDERVQFVQCDCGNPKHVDRFFKSDEKPFDVCVNLAGETFYGKDDKVYEQLIVNVAKAVGKAAADNGVGKFIELSTAQVYKSGKKPRRESKEIKPWTGIAKAKYATEQALKEMKLPLIILRPSLVYGVGDMTGLSPRIVCAATYTHTKRKMQLLYTGDLKINCVHVIDVARAIVHAANSLSPGDIYNLSDKSDLTQKKFNAHLSTIFGIKIGYFGKIISTLAQTRLKDAVDSANDEHLEPWNEMKKKSKIRSSPLSPFIDVELLSNKYLSVDGTAIESTGFSYSHPVMKTEDIELIISSFQKLRLFPDFEPI